MAMLQGRVLITGASGFIGGRLRDRLLAEGNDVVAIRRPGSPAGNKGRTVEARYEDLAELTRIFETEQPDYVIHVAGVTKGVSYDDFVRGNVLPTDQLLKAASAAKTSVKRFVHVSSLTSYGPASKDQCLTEDSPRRPIEFYGRSKLEAERAVERSDIPWTIVRPAGIYGPGDVDYFELFKAASNRVNVFFGNEHRLASHLYVDECVDGILMSATTEKSAGNGYFLTQGDAMPWGEFQGYVVDAVGKKAVTLRLPELIVKAAAMGGELATRMDGKPRLLNRQKAIMGAQDAWTCSGEKARKDFGFHAKIHPTEGTRLAHDWYSQNRWY